MTQHSVPPALAEPNTGPRAVSGSVTGGMTILSHGIGDQFADIRQRITAIEDAHPQIRGMLVTARDLLTRAEDQLAAAAEDLAR